MDGEKERRPRRRLTGARREKFLEVLAQTGNRGMAAAAIGIDPRLMDQRRKYDPLLDKQWSEALDRADRRLAGVDGPYDPAAGGAAVVVVKRSSNGRIQLQKAGEKRWSRAVEDRFFATLAMCGNIRASARAVGFSQSCIDQRRRKWPDFARRLEEALDDAEVEIEFRVAAEVSGKRAEAATDPEAAIEPGPIDMDAAMRFLKWRQEKKAGRGRRGRIPAPPSIEEVTERIVKRVQAIRRHRARGGTAGRRERTMGRGTKRSVVEASRGGEPGVTVTGDSH